MALSQQLKAISEKLHQDTQQQANVGLAQNSMQTSQALSQLPATGPQAKGAAQQTAAAVTQADQAVVNQAAQQQAQGQAQLGQAALQQKGAAQQASLGRQQLLNDEQISELQRRGQLRQNSATLDSAKKLQGIELASIQRMTSAKIKLQEDLSFLTRKQREDLNSLGAYTKHMLFDQRLMFEASEDKRRFTNTQQLADYSVASMRSDVQLNQRMREMQQAAQMEMTALQHAHNMITSKMEMEFKRAESQKDYALLKDLKEKQQALEEKMRRKAAKGSMTSNIIVGAFTIAGAVIGGSVTYGTGTAAGAMAGAAIGQGVGQMADGGAQSQDAY